MAPFQSGFEKGSDGNAISTGDTGNPDAFGNIYTNALTYSNTHAHYGLLSAKIDNTASVAAERGVGWSSGLLSEHWGRCYLYMTSAIASGIDGPISLGNSLSNNRPKIGIIATTNQLFFRDTTGSINGTVAVALNQWVRIEWHVLHSTTVGTVDLRLYNTPEAAVGSFDDQITGSSRNIPTHDRMMFGYGGAPGSAAVNILWIDDVAVEGTSFFGPAAVPAIPTVTRFRRDNRRRM